MFFELPADDGIVRIEEIVRIEFGDIKDSGLTVYEKEVPDTHYMIIHMKECHYRTHYGYRYLSWELMWNEVSTIKRRLSVTENYGV